MVVLAIVFAAFFGAGIVFGLNWIYSRSVRRVPDPPAVPRQGPSRREPPGEDPRGGDSDYEVWPYRH